MSHTATLASRLGAARPRTNPYNVEHRYGFRLVQQEIQKEITIHFQLSIINYQLAKAYGINKGE